MRTIKAGQGLMVCAAALVLCGCAEKLTFERWETIQKGTSSRAAVEATLGDPWQELDNEWVYYDADRSITAWVYFDGDEVTGKVWNDLDRGTVGESPNVKQPGEVERRRIEKIE